jgi:hypothetical protein
MIIDVLVREPVPGSLGFGLRTHHSPALPPACFHIVLRFSRSQTPAAPAQQIGPPFQPLGLSSFRAQPHQELLSCLLGR